MSVILAQKVSSLIIQKDSFHLFNELFNGISKTHDFFFNVDNTKSVWDK